MGNGDSGKLGISILQIVKLAPYKFPKLFRASFFSRRSRNLELPNIDRTFSEKQDPFNFNF